MIYELARSMCSTDSYAGTMKRRTPTSRPSGMASFSSRKSPAAYMYDDYDSHPYSRLSSTRLVILVVSAVSFMLLLAIIEFEIVTHLFPYGQKDASASKYHQETYDDDDSYDDDDHVGEEKISITAMDNFEPIQGQAKRQPRPIVVAGPSGVGKGTLINKLLDYYTPPEVRGYEGASKGGDYFGFSVSHTTRGPRPGESHGIHYYFSSRSEVQQAIDNGDFIEYAEVHGNIYGTSFDSVHRVARSGRVCILDIDIAGVKGVKQSSLDPRYVFIAPPSMEQLAQRLRDRGTETEEALKIRTANAAKEVEYGETPGNFDAIIVNDDLEEAFQRLLAQVREWYPYLPASVQK